MYLARRRSHTWIACESVPQPDRLHLVVTPTELDIVVDALRSVGNVELADRFEAVLHHLGQDSARERHA